MTVMPWIFVHSLSLQFRQENGLPEPLHPMPGKFFAISASDTNGDFFWRNLIRVYYACRCVI